MSYIAIDIGATNIRVATGDYTGLIEKVMEPTETREGPMGVSRQIIRLIDSIKEEDPTNIGIGSIGPINLELGTITNTPNYSFHNIPIKEPLIEEYKVPVTMVNDCAAAVVGEQYFGAGSGLRNLVYVTISTGLGGGAIVDDNLLLGKEGNAVEVGHFTLDPESEIVCGCGCRGHWEGFCSGSNIPKYASYLLRGTDWSGGVLHMLTGGSMDKLDAKVIFEAARKGDKYAKMIVEELGYKNAIGFANIVNAYDPELITVGGSIALNNPDQVLKPIIENIEKHTINTIPEIKITPLGHDSVILGALALALNF
ncbi:MAG: ROK family protein [Candidatus Bathyarchaeota archaeon]|nr:ROK family protein [Candidatus Bathyarchaeota archaeon]